jgi:hypothetical protein
LKDVRKIDLVGHEMRRALLHEDNLRVGLGELFKMFAI